MRLPTCSWEPVVAQAANSGARSAIPSAMGITKADELDDGHNLFSRFETHVFLC
jgi:hypothetical protein